MVSLVIVRIMPSAGHNASPPYAHDYEENCRVDRHLCIVPNPYKGSHSVKVTNQRYKPYEPGQQKQYLRNRDAAVKVNYKQSTAQKEKVYCRIGSHTPWRQRTHSIDRFKEKDLINSKVDIE